MSKKIKEERRAEISEQAKVGEEAKAAKTMTEFSSKYPVNVLSESLNHEMTISKQDAAHSVSTFPLQNVVKNRGQKADDDLLQVSPASNIPPPNEQFNTKENQSELLVGIAAKQVQQDEESKVDNMQNMKDAGLFDTNTIDTQKGNIEVEVSLNSETLLQLEVTKSKKNLHTQIQAQVDQQNSTFQGE